MHAFNDSASPKHSSYVPSEIAGENSPTFNASMRSANFQLKINGSTPRESFKKKAKMSQLTLK